MFWKTDRRLEENKEENCTTDCSALLIVWPPSAFAEFHNTHRNYEFPLHIRPFIAAEEADQQMFELDGKIGGWEITMCVTIRCC